jgi:small subunit ribosomal protein S8
LERVDLPSSSIKKEIANILKEEGFIADYKVLPDRKQGVLRLTLRYLPNKTRVIKGLRRVSRPGLRVYRPADAIPKVQGGLGMTIMSTSKGIMGGRKAKKSGMGGEVLAQVW